MLDACRNPPSVSPKPSSLRGQTSPITSKWRFLHWLNRIVVQEGPPAETTTNHLGYTKAARSIAASMWLHQSVLLI